MILDSTKLCPFLSAVSEVESTKGSGDCLPKLNYQNSRNDKATSSIVRLNGTVDSTMAQGSRGECRANTEISNLLLMSSEWCF